jgi:hypothetical protein
VLAETTIMMTNNFELNENLIIEQHAIGNHKLLVIDSFLKNPGQLQAVAANSQYQSYPGYKDRKGYPGIRALAPKEYSYNITIFLEPIIKREFGIPAQLDIRKSPCTFSLLTVKPDELGPLQRTPHFDSSTPHHVAALLYLCDQNHGGTAFYRHIATGLEQITEDTREHYLDTCFNELNTRRPEPEYIKDSTELYTKIGMVKAKFNRMVLYKGSILHAPFIESDVSISSNALTGRLTVNTFYDF